MNNETIVMLERLAQKLGTTSEYLWAVLLKQATITGVMNLFYFFAMLAAGYILFRIHLKLAKEVPDKYGRGSSLYDDNDNYEIAMIVATLIWGGAFLITFFVSLNNGIIAIIHPEYWALHQILSALGK